MKEFQPPYKPERLTFPLKRLGILSTVTILGGLVTYRGEDVGSKGFFEYLDTQGVAKIQYLSTPMPSAEIFKKVVASESLQPSPQITPTAISDEIISQASPVVLPVVSTVGPTLSTEKVEEEILPPATPQQVETPIADETWLDGDRPVYIELPDIGFSGEIQSTPLVPDGAGGLDYLLHTEGIATPEFAPKRLIYIFGHSYFNGQRRPFANVEYLEAGDLIAVKNLFNGSLCFAVSQFALATKDQVQYLWPKNNFRVVLQTTARSERGWLLNEANVISKVSGNIQADLNGYLVLLVVAEPIDQSLCPDY